MSDLKMLIATHKNVKLPVNEKYIPIQVGAALVDSKFLNITDDVGENISKKNPNYSELTALYWAWKNLRGVKYIGLSHYRRYFYSKYYFQHSKIVNEKIFVENIDEVTILPDYKKILEKYEIIKVKPFTYYHSVESVLISILSKYDLDVLEKIIKEDYPEYSDIYREYFKYNNKISSCNMFISEFDWFDEYCSWLFPLLERVEKNVQISKYTEPARIFGFLSEALFNVYCIKNKTKIKYLPITVVRDDINAESHLVYYLKNLRRNISFIFNKPKRK